VPSVITFSPTEHRALAQTGRGTLVGDLLRRYWLPALLSEEIAGPDSDPVRVRLLGEDLVAFRDTAGRPGLLAEYCPHRGASLFLGRNSEGGIRCSYHGWKFDIDGRGLECPNAPALAGTEDARQLAYPCQEAGGIVWAYLGPPQARPPLPDLGYLAADNGSRYAMKRWQDCHWLQALEVDIDSSHVAWLHREELLASPDEPKTRIILEHTDPHFEVAERDYGLLIGASRPDGDEDYWRVNQWLMPWYTFIPAESDDEVLGVHAWVPVDDDHCWVWGLSWHPRRPLTPAELEDWRAGRGGRFPELLPGSYQPRRNIGNQWEIDRPAQRSGRLWMGIEGNQEQDDAITASMGTAYDRSRERLVGTDLGVIATRRRLLACARDVAAGGDPPGAEGASYDVVPVSAHLPRGADWAAEIDAVIAARVGTGPQVPA
jgi:phenylpropionate dioxygenase-like ring-hydroxylating dioxygenase large terminal subunit